MDDALVGTEKEDGRGYLYESTVIANVPEGVYLRREEVFGPVTLVFSFGFEEDQSSLLLERRIPLQEVRNDQQH